MAAAGGQREAFGALLRRHRQRAALSQEQLAERAGLSADAVGTLERGRRTLPRPETVALLARALGLAGEERATFAAAARPAGAPDGAFPSAPGPPPRARPHSNLPAALSSFVGREREQAEVAALAGRARLVTLTGAGGVGKTRLALRVAEGLLAGYPDGAWLVELAALADPRLVPRTVARALGLREAPGEPAHETLHRHLRARHLVLVLDNCEHLLAACAELAARLLSAGAGLRILATSREGLGVPGEQIYHVPSLSAPDPRRPPDLAALAEMDAVRLFVGRARERRPGFALDAANAAAVAAICARLDGIPLAIELAAARLAALSPAQLAARLDDRFRLLTGGSPVTLPRQQTLRATMDWSWNLLSEPERALLRRLSVFAGGWNLEAAEAVCGGEGIAAEEVLDLLTGLVNKSLVAVDAGRAVARYALLETVRQYGHERLVAEGEGDRLRDRHLGWYLALTMQAAPAMSAQGQAQWMDRLERELENLRAALAWSSSGMGREEKGVQLVTGADAWWFTRGHESEGRHWLGGLLAAGAHLPPAVRARALYFLGLLASSQGDAHHAARAHDEACALFREAGDRRGTAEALLGRGQSAIHLGDHGYASTLLSEALGLLRGLGDRRGEAWTLCHFGFVAHMQGDWGTAAARYGESLELLSAVGDAWGVGNLLANLANVARDRGDYGRARQLHRQSLQVRLALEDQSGFAECFEGLAVVAAGLGHPERAARLFGAAERVREAIGRPLELLDRAAHQAVVPAVRAALGGEMFAACWAEGRAMPLDSAITLALEGPGEAPPNA